MNYKELEDSIISLVKQAEDETRQFEQERCWSAIWETFLDFQNSSDLIEFIKKVRRKIQIEIDVPHTRGDEPEGEG